MLVQLSIKNFAVVRELTVNFEHGLTAITGETGAGKSIAIDALSLCLGERADAGSVRKEASKAEIVAHFALNENSAAMAWTVSACSTTPASEPWNSKSSVGCSG